MTERVLIYRLGSLGDTVMALPAFHLVRRCFPDAEIRVLTDFTRHSKAPAMAAVLGDSGLVDGYFEYPLATRSAKAVLKVAATVRRWRPEVAVYMAAPRGKAKAWRDFCFLRACGARRITGAPLSDALQAYQLDHVSGLWESEAARLARCLTPLGDADIGDRAHWDLLLSDEERAAGADALGNLRHRGFLAISPGGKTAVQDWGEDRWTATLKILGARLPTLGILAVGAGEEHARCDRLLDGWPGPTVNLCGRVAPRVTAAAMAAGLGFLGHDSGPLHLAAAVGLPCTGIFSSRARKGMWFPPGEGHRCLYTDIDCSGCGLLTCDERGKACLAAITPEVVAGNVLALLAHHQRRDVMAGAAE